MSWVPSAFLVTRLCLKHMHTRHCPWVCTCSSRVILLTLYITGGDIALPFGKTFFLGKESGFLAECHQESHCPVNKITSCHTSTDCPKGLCAREPAPCKVGGTGSQRSRGPWPCPPVAQNIVGAQVDEAKVVICLCSHGEIMTK